VHVRLSSPGGEDAHRPPSRDWNGDYRCYAPPRAFIDTARLFQSVRSQAVRLPKDYRFRTTASAAAKWPSSAFRCA
jgi:hypothetical protein